MASRLRRSRLRHPRRRRVGKRGGDEGDLLLYTADEFGLVAAGDAHCLDAGSQDAALYAQGGALALVSFRVDHPHPGGCHDDVVDVCARAGDAAVMKHAEVVGKLFEPFGEAFFSDSAALPGFGALRVVRQSEDESAELRVFVRIRCSRAVLRRSCSRRAEAPATPVSCSKGAVVHATQRIVFVRARRSRRILQVAACRKDGRSRHSAVASGRRLARVQAQWLEHSSGVPGGVRLQTRERASRGTRERPAGLADVAKERRRISGRGLVLDASDRVLGPRRPAACR